MRRCAGMRGDYRSGKIRLDFWARRSYLKGMAISRRAHAAPYCPRRDLRAGFRRSFQRPFRQGFRWPFRIGLPEVPAIPNPAPPAGFAFRRHLCGTPMSVHESRTRDSDLAADSYLPRGSRPHARRLRYRLRAGYATLLCRTPPPSIRRRIARRGRLAAGGWLGVARRPPVSSSVRPPVRSPVRPLRGFEEGGFLARQRRLLALRFANIPTSRKGWCARPGCRTHSRGPVWLDAPFAPDAFAIASALATQRFSGPPRWRCAGPGVIA
jgi:hypothetical protein